MPDFSTWLLRRWPAVLAFVAVLFVYAFFGSHGRFRWDFGEKTGWYYSRLASGFLSGQLNLRVKTDPAMKALPNPYDFEARKNVPSFWDTSYYKGKYYLYFSPLPALFLYVPARLLTGRYPHDPLAVTLFAMCAFALWVAFVARALRIREAGPAIPFPLLILIVGLGNMVPFVMTASRTYEVAITCAMALSAAWALSLLRVMEQPVRGTAAWMGVWLALAINARPTLAPLLAAGALAIWIAGAGLRERVRLATAALIPLAIGAIVSGWYNWARYDSPFTTGLKYQLTLVSMEGKRICSLCSWAEGGRLLNSSMQYLFTPPTFWRAFPLVMMQNNVMDPGISYPGVPEAVIGIGALNPITMIGTLAAAVMALMPLRDPRLRTALCVLVGGWLVLLALSTCWWVVARYELDFAGLIVIGSVVATEFALQTLGRTGLSTLPLRIAVGVIGCYAVIVGVLLGFSGPGGAFQEGNPMLFARIANLLR